MEKKNPMTPQQAALDAIDELIMEMRQSRHMKFADRLVTIREALTTQDLSMKEPGANLRSAETTSDAAPIINKAGGVPSPGKAQGVDANQITAIKKVLMAAARKDTQKETNYEIGTAISMLGEIQSGAGLWQRIDDKTRRGIEYLICDIETGTMIVASLEEDDRWHTLDGLGYSRDAFTYYCSPKPPIEAAMYKTQPPRSAHD
jgi:hypothetical protein